MTDPSDQPPKKPPAGENRRRHPRARVQLLIQYRFDTFEEFLAEYSVDLSKSGIFIRTRTPRAEGSFVYLQFALRDGSRIIEGLGKVARVNPPGVPGSEAGMGIEFVDFDEESMAVIQGIVEKKLAGGR